MMKMNRTISNDITTTGCKVIMKKITTVLLLAVVFFSMAACNEEKTTIDVITPQGSPALAALYLHENEAYEMDIVNGPDPLVSAFGSGSHDVILAPTNLGAKMHASGSDYRFLGAITFGNYYLVTQQQDGFTFDSLDGKEIVMFGRMQTGDAIVQYLCQDTGIEPSFTYVDSVQSASALWLENPETIILTAEPSLSVLSANHDLSIIDIQEIYQETTGDGSYPQAGVFVNKRLSEDRMDEIASDIEASVEDVLDDPDSAATFAASLDYPFPESVMASAIPRCHLGFIAADDVKDDLEAYFTRLSQLNPQLYGGELPEEKFYVVGD